jgi:hypothetical protein
MYPGSPMKDTLKANYFGISVKRPTFWRISKAPHFCFTGVMVQIFLHLNYTMPGVSISFRVEKDS